MKYFLSLLGIVLLFSAIYGLVTMLPISTEISAYERGQYVGKIVQLILGIVICFFAYRKFRAA